MNTNEKSLEESIINLYLSLKIRKNDEFNVEAEKEKLKTINPKLILDYIKSSIDIMINIKVEERVNSHIAKAEQRTIENLPQEDEPINEYEAALRHLESEIRNHIRIEHQLKLHSETLQTRVEELEKSKDDLKLKMRNYQEQISKVKNGTDGKEMELIKSENNNLKLLIKSYEDRNNIIIELEKKLRMQQARYEKEVKDLENAHKEKIKSYLRININKNVTSKKNLNNDDDLSRNLIKNEKDDKLNTKTTSSVINMNQISHRASSVTERKKDSNYMITKKPSDKNNNVKFIIDDIKEQKKDLVRNKNPDYADTSAKLSVSNHVNKESCKNLLKSGDSTDIGVLYIPKTHRKKESVSKEILQKVGNKHIRNYSFDKLNKPNNSSNNISVNPPVKPVKKIYEMKEQNKQLVGNNKSVPTSGKISIVNINNNQNNSSLFPNPSQLNVPLINNINIYASNMNNFKTNDINVRQYIYNKINKPKQNMKKIRSISQTNQ